MSAIFEIVGMIAVATIAVVWAAICVECALRILPPALRASIAVVVKGAGVRRIRNAIREHHERRAELLRDRDHWRVWALWLEKQLHERGILPEYPPPGMTPEQALQAEQDAVRAAYGDPS